MRFIHPNSIVQYGFEWDWNGNLRMHSTYTKVSEYRGKQLVFGFNCDPSTTISPSPKVHMMGYVDSSMKPFLYVCPEVSISRDSLRNSGYKLVRSKDKANCVVVPDMHTVMSFCYNFAVITKSDDVFLFCFSGATASTATFEENKVNNIIKQCIGDRVPHEDGENLEIINDKKLGQHKAYTIIPCDEYEAMYDSNANSDNPVSYCFENNLKITPSTEVNPELFAVWSKCSDSDIIASAVMQTDWQTYPFTIAVFLRNKFPYIYANKNKSFQYVLNEIGFYDLKNSNTSSKLISPEDWNMLQKCSLYFLGLPENGGFLPPEKEVSSLLPHKICVKPLYIDSPASYETLRALVKI